MLNFKYVRAALVTTALAALTLSRGAVPLATNGNLEEPDVLNGAAAECMSVSPEAAVATSTFYRLRRDLRKCISPICGGYFVTRVNSATTRCTDGSFKRECYVAEIDWNGQPQGDSSDLLVRGKIVAKGYGTFGNLGQLVASESWMSIGTKEPSGPFYLVRDNGVRCIAYPCPTHREAKLNSSFTRNIAGVELEAASFDQNTLPLVLAAMTGPDAAILSGDHLAVTGPGGNFFVLKATQVYFRNKSDSGSSTPGRESLKRCFKSGCSNQVCSDHNVITTCEWRPEYECYQKAMCERQHDGNCGFTKTPELAACLARK
jgi:hypothetical protein